MQSLVIDDKVRCPAAYKGEVGYYGYTAPGIDFTWVGCRNTLNSTLNARLFHNINTMDLEKAKQESGFFYCLQGNPEPCLKCIHLLETHLNLYSRSCVHTTNVNGVMYVEPSKFWHTCPIRLSFFTIYVRASMRATAGTNVVPELERILPFDTYFKDTTHATKAFLSGNTYCDSFQLQGWRDRFSPNPLAAKKLENPRQFTHDIWLQKVKAKAEVLVNEAKNVKLVSRIAAGPAPKTAAKPAPKPPELTPEQYYKKAEYFCSLAACVG